MTITIDDIDKKAKAYSRARDKLQTVLFALELMLKKARDGQIGGIKRCSDEVIATYKDLEAMVGKAPTLFTKPKTLVMYNIRVGYTKQRGKIHIPDEAKTIRLIRKHLKDQAGMLIIKKEAVSKNALDKLTVEDLKKIGCTVGNDADAVVIKSVDSEAEKLVNAMLKAVTGEAI